MEQAALGDARFGALGKRRARAVPASRGSPPGDAWGRRALC